MSTIIEPTFVEQDGKRTHAVIDIEQWHLIIRQLEDVQDNRDADRALTEPALQLDQAERIWAGTHPLKVWREHQGLTQQTLADKTGVSQTTIAQIENGTRQGSVKTLKKLADVLDVKADDLLP